MMAEYFYTINLGETYGRKLERLAERASYHDLEEFAAMTLAHAIDQWEEHERGQDEALAVRLDQSCFFDAGLMRDPLLVKEDDIPF